MIENGDLSSEEEDNIMEQTVAINYNWIVGVTTTHLDNFKSIKELNLIGKKQLLISNKRDGVRYNDYKVQNYKFMSF